MTFLSTGFVRGLLAQALATLAGTGFVAGIRALSGLDPFDPIEPALVSGFALGALAFLFGVGVFDDWLKWTRGISTPDHQEHDAEKPWWFRYLNVDFDHKVIGLQYGATAMLTMGIGGSLALLFRTELATADVDFLEHFIFGQVFGDTGASLFNTFISLHGMIMIVTMPAGIQAVIFEPDGTVTSGLMPMSMAPSRSLPVPAAS